MSISLIELLKHIRDEARFLESATAGITQEQFLEDEVLKRACVRAIEIIGDGARSAEMVSTEIEYAGPEDIPRGVSRRVPGGRSGAQTAKMIPEEFRVKHPGVGWRKWLGCGTD